MNCFHPESANSTCACRFNNLSHQWIRKVAEDKVDTQRQIRFGHAEKKTSFSEGCPYIFV